MNNELNILEKLTLLALDDDKGTFLTDSIYFGHAITGAAFIQLLLDGALLLEEGKLIVNEERKIVNAIFEPYLGAIHNSKKNRSMEHWMQYFANKASNTTNACVQGLIDRGILTKQENKVLWVFTQKKYPALDSRLEDELKAHLLKIADARQKPTEQDIILMQLVDLCELGKIVYGKVAYKQNKAYIKKLIKEQELSGAVAGSIKAAQDAVVACITALTAAVMITVIIN